ncbi:Elongation factor 1-gamma, partial [Galemys pyrenaicus]
RTLKTLIAVLHRGAQVHVLSIPPISILAKPISPLKFPIYLLLVRFAGSEIVPPVNTWVFPTLNITYHKQAIENAEEKENANSGAAGCSVEDKTFPVGKHVTVNLGTSTPVRTCSLWCCYTFGSFLITMLIPVVLHYFPEELTQIFMSCITGTFQQLDMLRKNGFFQCYYMFFETNSSSSISRVWGHQGQELVFLLSPDWGWITSQVHDRNWILAERRPRCGSRLHSWEGSCSVGRTFNQGKIF